MMKIILLALPILAIGILPSFCQWQGEPATAKAKTIPVEFRELPR